MIPTEDGNIRECSQCDELRAAYGRVMAKYNEHLKTYWAQKEDLKKSQASNTLLTNMLQEDKAHRVFLQQRLDTAEQALFLKSGSPDSLLLARAIGPCHDTTSPTDRIRELNDERIQQTTEQISRRDPELACSRITPPLQTRDCGEAVRGAASSVDSPAIHDATADREPETTANFSDRNWSSKGAISQPMKPSGSVILGKPPEIKRSLVVKPYAVISTDSLVSEIPGLGVGQRSHPSLQRRKMIVASAKESESEETSETTTSSGDSESSIEQPVRTAKKLIKVEADQACGDRAMRNTRHVARPSGKGKIASPKQTKAPPSGKQKNEDVVKTIRSAQTGLFKEWKQRQTQLMSATNATKDCKAPTGLKVAKSASENISGPTRSLHIPRAFPTARPTKSMQLKDDFTRLKYEMPSPQWVARAGPA